MLRARALFLLAHVCHLSPADVDDLAFTDFLSLSITAEEWMKKAGPLSA